MKGGRVKAGRPGVEMKFRFKVFVLVCLTGLAGTLLGHLPAAAGKYAYSTHT